MKQELDSQTRLVRARIPSILIIDVTEEELQIIKQGKKSPIQHTIAVALFSSAIGLSVTFILNFASLEPWLKSALLVLVVVFIVSGICLIILNARDRDTFNEVVKRIETRKEAQFISTEDERLKELLDSVPEVEI